MTEALLSRHPPGFQVMIFSGASGAGLFGNGDPKVDQLVGAVDLYNVWPPLNNSYTLFKVGRKKAVPQEKNYLHSSKDFNWLQLKSN